MKKIKLLTVLLIVATMVFSIAACVGTPTLESISLKEDTLPVSVVQGGALDTSRVVVIAHYDDGTTKEVTVVDSNLTIGTISTSEVGTQTLTITYMDKTLDVTVTVYAMTDVDDPVTPEDPNASIDIVRVMLPDFVTEYRSNIATQTNKQDEFTDRENGYFVGDDNEFIFKPDVLAEDEDGFPVNVSESMLDLELTVEVMEGSAYVVKNEDDYLSHTAYGKITFREEALNKQIKLTAKPFIVGYPDNATETVSIEFTVVDGWNAYSAADLAMIEYDRAIYEENLENSYELDCAAAWDLFKTEHNLPTNRKTNAVILHDDLTVTKSDLPSILFYNDGDEDLSSSDEDYARAKGSLRDFKDIYFRTLLPNETFDLIGNYFTVDAESIPFVTRDNGEITDVGEVISHTSLIKVVGQNGAITAGQSIGKATISNMFIKGNSQRTENPAASGGLIFHKVGDVDFTINNVISRKWFITFFAEKGMTNATKYSVEDCKAYDSFNSFLYIWGVNGVSVDNSEMIGAGGPVMIVDHVAPNQAEGGYPSLVNVTDSYLESSVSGEEGWFNLVGASLLIPSLKGPDQLFRGYGKTYLRNANGGTELSANEASYFNLICVVKSGEAEGLSFDPIKGNVSIDDNAPLNFGDAEDPASMLAKLHLTGLQTTGAPVFQSSAGGVGFTDGSAPMKKLNATTYQPENILDPADPLFQGDYLNFYFSQAGSTGFMAAMMGYYSVEQN